MEQGPPSRNVHSAFSIDLTPYEYRMALIIPVAGLAITLLMIAIVSYAHKVPKENDARSTGRQSPGLLIKKRKDGNGEWYGNTTPVEWAPGQAVTFDQGSGWVGASRRRSLGKIV
jgi:hypothetical protein